MVVKMLNRSKENKTDTGSRVCGDHILIFRKWKRSIDRVIDRVIE